MRGKLVILALTILVCAFAWGLASQWHKWRKGPPAGTIPMEKVAPGPAPAREPAPLPER